MLLTALSLKRDSDEVSWRLSAQPSVRLSAQVACVEGQRRSIPAAHNDEIFSRRVWRWGSRAARAVPEIVPSPVVVSARVFN
jgi:hypothetical protein